MSDDYALISRLCLPHPHLHLLDNCLVFMFSFIQMNWMKNKRFNHFPYMFWIHGQINHQSLSFVSVIWWRDTGKTSFEGGKGDVLLSESPLFFRISRPDILPRYQYISTLTTFVCFSSFYPLYVFVPLLSGMVNIFTRCDIVQTRCLSNNVRACLYALKYCKFIVDLYFLFI